MEELRPRSLCWKRGEHATINHPGGHYKGQPLVLILELLTVLLLPKFYIGTSECRCTVIITLVQIAIINLLMINVLELLMVLVQSSCFTLVSIIVYQRTGVTTINEQK